MNWEHLLSLSREGDTVKRLRSDQDETRLGFEVDYDRIIFSSAFRSLQDKTQVVPLPIQAASRKGFVHTRLTHSLEVSVVGRSIGSPCSAVVASRTRYPSSSRLVRNTIRMASSSSTTMTVRIIATGQPLRSGRERSSQRASRHTLPATLLRHNPNAADVRINPGSGRSRARPPQANSSTPGRPR